MVDSKGQVRFEEACDLVRRWVPKFHCSLKSQSWIHRTIGKILIKLGNSGYTDHFWTTLGSWTARPAICDQGPPADEWQIILHEGWHGAQAMRRTPLGAALLYSLPQLLGPLGAGLGVLMALLTGHLAWLWLLTALVLCLPIPAWFRADAERQAYKISAAVMFWYYGDLNDSTIDGYLVEEFVSGDYFWMWPFRNRVRTWWLAWVHDLRYGEWPGKDENYNKYLEECRALALRYAQEDGLD